MKCTKRYFAFSINEATLKSNFNSFYSRNFGSKTPVPNIERCFFPMLSIQYGAHISYSASHSDIEYGVISTTVRDKAYKSFDCAMFGNTLKQYDRLYKSVTDKFLQYQHLATFYPAMQHPEMPPDNPDVVLARLKRIASACLKRELNAYSIDAEVSLDNINCTLFYLPVYILNFKHISKHTKNTVSVFVNGINGNINFLDDSSANGVGLNTQSGFNKPYQPTVQKDAWQPHGQQGQLPPTQANPQIQGDKSDPWNKPKYQHQQLPDRQIPQGNQQEGQWGQNGQSQWGRNSQGSNTQGYNQNWGQPIQPQHQQQSQNQWGNNQGNVQGWNSQAQQQQNQQEWNGGQAQDGDPWNKPQYQHIMLPPQQQLLTHKKNK